MDVGVGMGTELATYSRLVGSRGHVIGFEAHPKSFTIACLMRDKNQLKNVDLIRQALWDSPGTILLSDSPDSLGINSAVDEVLLDGPTIEVESTTLDLYQWPKELNRISFLKLNVEGAELRVLLGANEVLPRVENLCVSTHDFLTSTESKNTSMQTRSAVMEVLTDHGFSILQREDHRPVIRDMIYATRKRKEISLI